MCIYTLIGAVEILHKKSIDMMLSGVKGQKLLLWVSSLFLKVAEPEPLNLEIDCYYSP